MCLGHESAGDVVKLGENLARKAELAIAMGDAALGPSTLQVGDRVALEPGTTCRMCDDCRTGQYQICEHMQFAAYPPFHGTLQRYYKLCVSTVLVC